MKKYKRNNLSTNYICNESDIWNQYDDDDDFYWSDRFTRMHYEEPEYEIIKNNQHLTPTTQIKRKWSNKKPRYIIHKMSQSPITHNVVDMMSIYSKETLRQKKIDIILSSDEDMSNTIENILKYKNK